MQIFFLKTFLINYAQIVFLQFFYIGVQHFGDEGTAEVAVVAVFVYCVVHLYILNLALPNCIFLLQTIFLCSVSLASHSSAAFLYCALIMYYKAALPVQYQFKKLRIYLHQWKIFGQCFFIQFFKSILYIKSFGCM